MTVTETRTIVAGDGEDIVVETIRAMAAAKGIHHTDLDVPIGDVMDPDALTRLFTTDSTTPYHEVSVSVSLDEFQLTIGMHDPSVVTIEVAPAPGHVQAGDQPTADDARNTGNAGS